MKKNGVSVVLVAILVLSLNMVVSGETMTARDIFDKSFEVGKLAGSEAVLTLTIVNRRGNERVRKMAMVTKLVDQGRTEKTLMRFLAPADVKGTGFLTYDYEDKDDDMWLFMPALRKSRRIVSDEKSKSFMGSEFSYADMAPPTLNDFNFENLGEEAVDGVPCWKIQMVPKSDGIASDNGFSKRVSLIGKEDFMVRKSVYYDLDGKLEKELTVFDIKEVDPDNHKYMTMHMEMVNKLNNRKSVIKIEKVVFNPNISDEYFSTRYLERF